MRIGLTGELPVGEGPIEQSGARAKPSHASLEQAAQWYVTLRDTGASEEDRRAWQAWLAQSEEHIGAWRFIEAVSRRFEPLRGRGQGGTAAAVAGVGSSLRFTARRRHLIGGLVGALGAGLVGWYGWQRTALPELVAALRADLRTDRGEHRNLDLADGTRVWLNTSTAVNVDYAGEERRLVLLAGELLVETAVDSLRRPFYVDTRFGRMQALGTRFTVGQLGPRTRLDVFEGAVAIDTTGGQTRRVEAGQAVGFDATSIVALGRASGLREAWRRGRIPAESMPLRELMDELGRYGHGHISVAPQIADLKVMGVYPTDVDKALTMLEQNLPIRVRRTLPWWISVEGR